MSFGGSIFLIAVGLVLALAVNVSVSGIDLQLVGWILALVGVVGLLLSLVFYQRRRPAAIAQHRPSARGGQPGDHQELLIPAG
jgi:membrane associated rhomboid family serine protease